MTHISITIAIIFFYIFLSVQISSLLLQVAYSEAHLSLLLSHFHHLVCTAGEVERRACVSSWTHAWSRIPAIRMKGPFWWFIWKTFLVMMIFQVTAARVLTDHRLIGRRVMIHLPTHLPTLSLKHAPFLPIHFTCDSHECIDNILFICLHHKRLFVLVPNS